MVVQRGDSDAREITACVFREGGVAILPCDTVYGLCGPVPSAAERLRRIKGRGEEKGFIILIPDAGDAKRLLENPVDPALAELWPGPLTIVAPKEDGETAALRVPADRFLIAVMRDTGPIYSTSVNRSGAPHLTRIDEIITEFGPDVDLIVDAGELPPASPSTVVDTTVVPYRVLRQGDLVVPPELLDPRNR